MDIEFTKRMVDFWEPFELVEFLGLSTFDILDAFRPEIEDAQEDLEEFMNIGTRNLQRRRESGRSSDGELPE